MKDGLVGIIATEAASGVAPILLRRERDVSLRIFEWVLLWADPS